MSWVARGVAGWCLWSVCAALGDPGNNCAVPIRVQLPAAVPYVDVNTTCGRGDDYRDTCLGAFDDGEDVIYELVLARDMNVRLHVTGPTAAGIALDTVCPPASSCLALRVDPGDRPPRLEVQLAAGTYYAMIDTRPPPNCSAYTLTIEELPPLQPGDSCQVPRVVRLPADLPFADTGQTTCGRCDFYSHYESCLGPFSGGQEMIYELEVTAPVDIEIMLNPLGYGWTAMALDAPCPPGGPTCHAASFSEAGQPHGPGCVPLQPGRYTLMIDRLPSAAWGDCIPAFDLALVACELPRGACCVAGNCIGTLPVVSCLAQGGRWYAGFDCASLPCPTLLPGVPESCPTALPLTTPEAVELYTGPALPGPPPGSCNAPGTVVMQNDAWFTYTAVGDVRLSLDVRYDYDGLTAVYTGGDCLSLTELYCLNSGTGVRPDRDTVTFQATAGTTYWFQLGDFGINPEGGWTLVVLKAEAATRPGDVNCDGRVDFGDINPFVTILTNPALWQATYPHCPFLNGDINGDGRVDFGDINPFVTLLVNP